MKSHFNSYNFGTLSYPYFCFSQNAFYCNFWENQIRFHEYLLQKRKNTKLIFLLHMILMYNFILILFFCNFFCTFINIALQRYIISTNPNISNRYCIYFLVEGTKFTFTKFLLPQTFPRKKGNQQKILLIVVFTFWFLLNSKFSCSLNLNLSFFLHNVCLIFLTSHSFQGKKFRKIQAMNCSFNLLSSF